MFRAISSPSRRYYTSVLGAFDLDPAFSSGEGLRGEENEAMFCDRCFPLEKCVSRIFGYVCPSARASLNGALVLVIIVYLDVTRRCSREHL